jgi:hypothetical protein
MVSIFIVIGQYAIQCLNAVCSQISYEILQGMKAAGYLELVFELTGVVMIYVRKRKKWGGK